MKIPNGVRDFNKRFLTPLTVSVARSSWGMFCMIYHVGRRSGKQYETPIIAFPTTFGFVVALTYGQQVDWYQNITAAGHCQIGWHGQVYAIQKIEPMDPRIALSLLPRLFRIVLSLVGLKDFIKLEGQSPKQVG